MTDPRIETDEVLNKHYADHPHVKYCDLHDDYAIAYIFGVQHEYPYDEEPNHQDLIARIDSRYEEMKNKTLFRYHRGDYHQSMQTTILVSSLAELDERIRKECEYILPTSKITVKPYCTTIDSRNGWESFIVEAKGHGVIGFTNKQLE